MPNLIAKSLIDGRVNYYSAVQTQFQLFFDFLFLLHQILFFTLQVGITLGIIYMTDSSQSNANSLLKIFEICIVFKDPRKEKQIQKSTKQPGHM